MCVYYVVMYNSVCIYTYTYIYIYIYMYTAHTNEVC